MPMKRKIIHIEGSLCNGCGLCIPNCPEGAIQMIDGKARLISDLFCDGLGACLGHCPEGAIVIEEREAEPYDESKVIENIIKEGPNTVRAHLIHLKEHGEQGHLKTALDILRHKGLSPDIEGMDAEPAHRHAPSGGCPGSAQVQLKKGMSETREDHGSAVSELTHWPIQLHLISPSAAAYQGADVVLAADCAAYAAGDFHRKFLKGRALAIACPKLDDGQEIYSRKLTALIDLAKINTLTVVIMEVPCCGGLLRLAQQAAASASRKIPVKSVVLGRNGQILQENWL
jgi:Pyruvate/2-oxoacid:ferredoxin oxidoreductase delta subunit